MRNACYFFYPRCSWDVLSDKNLTKPKHPTRDFRADKSVAAPEEMRSYLELSRDPTTAVSSLSQQKEVITV